MRSEEVLYYLKEHPEFFEEYADALAAMQIPHPHGGRAIPIAERQVLTLREKSRALEGKLRELVQFGEENDNISERVHRLTLALLDARDLSSLIRALCGNLRDDFGVPAVALRLWFEPASADQPEFLGISEEARVFADSLSDPYFSERTMFDSASWFEGGGDGLTSLVYLPLRTERVFGLLVLGSSDPQRFAADKGTFYLTRLGEIASMALRRYAGT